MKAILMIVGLVLLIAGGVVFAGGLVLNPRGFNVGGCYTLRTQRIPAMNALDDSLEASGSGSYWPDVGLGPVISYPQLDYSMHDVRRAGGRLAKAVIWDEADREEIYRTFAVASS